MADNFNPSTSKTVAWQRGSARSATAPLAGDIQREMLSAWQAGATVLAEQYLDRHPAVKAQPEMAVLVIYEELCLREERGETVDSAELYARFPQYRDALSVVLSCHRLMHVESATFPTAGETFGEFRLLRELGRGGAGRVFLATQPSLSDRPLVVKLTQLTGDEHLSLARLQHTHIVPLFLVQEFPERDLRALCMPFLGGASWSAILQMLEEAPATGPRSGQSVVQALERAQSELSLTPSSPGPAIGFLNQASYEHAVCWIGSCLAEGLHHAHQRGLMHLDIKPSNVLLAGDGQPMLLDFHLAHEVSPALGGQLNRVGGTHGYMSPEQQRCLEAVRSGLPAPVALDPRSDIYSLGVLLYESLTGQNPTAAATWQPSRSAAPTLSRGLEDLLRKCLDPQRESRYRDAGALAADLRRHVANLPLRGVANRSLKERWRKWRRRKPYALGVWSAILASSIVVLSAGLFFYADRLGVARSSLRQAMLDLAEEDQASALERLSTGLAAVRWLPGQRDLKQELQAKLLLAQRARVFQALRRLVEQLRFLDNGEPAPRAKLRELDAGCCAIWDARRQIVAIGKDRSQPKLEDEQIDLLDLALLWTRLITRDPTTGDVESARSKALTVLEQAQELWGPSPALMLAKAQLGESPVPKALIARLLATQPPRTAWEHDAVGQSLLQAGQFEAAREQTERATQLEPGSFWPHFHLALCAYRCERFEEALREACVCVALDPRRAECFFNRALCLDALGQQEPALADLTRAVELDPSLSAAALRRGVVLGQLSRPREALEELQRAADLGGDSARAYYQMALIHFERKEWTAAHECVERSLRHDARYAPAIDLQTRLLARGAPAPSSAGRPGRRDRQDLQD